jgi:hypothetical protein
MAEIATRQALAGGDAGAWASFEQTANHLAIGANTREAYITAGVLYLGKGMLGIYDGSQYWNVADAAISLAGLTASKRYFIM